MDFNDIEIFEMHSLFDKKIKLNKGQKFIIELKKKYCVLKEIAINGNKYKKGDYIFLEPSKFREGLIAEAKDQSDIENVIRKIKKYLDFKYNEGLAGEMFDVEFNKEFTKIKIFPL